MKKTSKKGFTLIEVMITVGLISLVTVLCVSLIIIGIRHSRQNSQRSAFQIGVNKFIAIMNNEINSVGNGKVTVEVDGDDKIEITINGKTETYRYDSESQQIEGTNDVLIAPYVKDAIFSYDTTRKLLNVKVQSNIDDGWLETSFYIR